MITISKISRSFGKKKIFSDLSFSVGSGEVCGLVGLNGIGKTTLLRIIAGTLSVNDGSVTVLGVSGPRNGAFYRRIGVVLDSDGFNGNLSFIDNLTFFARLRRISQEELNSYIDSYWTHLSSKPNPVKTFSRGERMQCGLARAFLGKPELLLLDEPASNLDMDGYKLLCRLVTDAHAQGASAIISSHRLDTISELCGTVAFLDEHGIRKISLEERSHLNWTLRGINLEPIPTIIESIGGAVVHRSPIEIRFSGTDRSQTGKIIPEIIESGAEIHELFLRDPVEAALEKNHAV